jgi:hypothetical protein
MLHSDLAEPPSKDGISDRDLSEALPYSMSGVLAPQEVISATSLEFWRIKASKGQFDPILLNYPV